MSSPFSEQVYMTSISSTQADNQTKAPRRHLSHHLSGTEQTRDIALSKSLTSAAPSEESKMHGSIVDIQNRTFDCLSWAYWTEITICRKYSPYFAKTACLCRHWSVISTRRPYDMTPRSTLRLRMFPRSETSAARNTLFRPFWKFDCDQGIHDIYKQNE